MTRMGEDRKPKQIISARPKGRRIRGRQRRFYTDAIE